MFMYVAYLYKRETQSYNRVFSFERNKSAETDLKNMYLNDVLSSMLHVYSLCFTGSH